MAAVKVTLTEMHLTMLMRVATQERRPPAMQAEWMLMQALEAWAATEEAHAIAEQGPGTLTLSIGKPGDGERP